MGSFNTKFIETIVKINLLFTQIYFCIPEILNRMSKTGYKNTNSKDDFVLKTQKKISGIQK